MQGTQNQTKSGSNSNMPFSKDSSSKDETSGLHDLQAMASSAKRRRSQRLSSQMDAQDSLLQSTAALDAVVLPDPNKEQVVAIADVAPIAEKAQKGSSLSTADAAVASVPSAVPATELAESTKSSGKGIYVAFVLAAAAAVAAYVLFTNKNATPAEPAAKPVAAVVPVAVEPEAVEPEVVEPAVEPAANLDDSATDDTATDPVDDVAKNSEEPSKPAVDVAKADKAPKSEKSSKSDNKASETKAKTQTTKVAAVDKKPVKDSKPAETKVEKKPDANASLDDVLSSVTGGVDKPIAKETTTAAPSKTSLSRGDIAKAMGNVKGSAKACYKLEEFSGMVKVKYSVGPDGTVTKAAATGAHASSKTGACVAKAAKKAKFPAYSGAAMSSTYPFLLAP